MKNLHGIAIWRHILRAVFLMGAILFLGGWSIFGLLDDQQGPPHNESWFGHKWDGAPTRDVRQNHQIHTQKEEIDCADCHPGALEKPRAGMVEMEACADCHDEANEDNKNKGGCLLCHNIESKPDNCTREACTEDDLPEFESKLGPSPYKNLKYAEGEKPGFSHAVHAKKDIACAECHGNIALEAADPFPTGKWMPRPQRCFDCHTKELEKPVATTCNTCHVEETYNRTTPPENHRGNWLAFHGGAAQLTPEGDHGTDCTTCHVQNDCVACHENQPPKNHTNFWRVRAHGLTASANREYCDTCHRQDFCVSCHIETAPKTHIGNWLGKHCINCHLADNSAPQEGCRACHEEAAHVAAPHPVRATEDCTRCHGP